jgi:hypothetical protein
MLSRQKQTADSKYSKNFFSVISVVKNRLLAVALIKTFVFFVPLWDNF